MVSAGKINLFCEGYVIEWSLYSGWTLLRGGLKKRFLYIIWTLLHGHTQLLHKFVNSLAPGDMIWHHGISSTLVQLMA